MTRPDTDTYLRYLVETDPLREQVNLDIIAALALPQGSSGLDVGCGVGTQALMLADAIGPEGLVTGLDANPTFLELANRAASARGLSDRVTFTQEDYERLTFDEEGFDWIWSSDCLGFASLPHGLTRLLKRGGDLILSFWSSEQLLPGYPLLEAKLKTTSGGLAPYRCGDPPHSHSLRTMSRLRDAGLSRIQVMTFVSSFHAPLSPVVRRALEDILEMRWPNAEQELSGEDRELYRRLTDPASSAFILDLPDYYGFFTYSVFRAVRDER